MNNLEINALLAQMRTTTSRLENSLPIEQTADTSQSEFKTLLNDSISKVSETQKTAQSMAESFEKGDPDTSLTEVMLQVQKADLSFRAMTEVRNKLVNAYQEIMNMPV